MNKIIILIISVFFCLTSFAQQNYSRASLWDDDIAKFKQNDLNSPPEEGGILFIGSSSFRAWRSLNDDFPKYNVLNRAFGGSHMADLIYYFDDIVVPYNPCQIIVYEGDNDIASGMSPEAYLQDVITFTRLVEIFLPGTELAFVSTKPSPAREKWSDEYQKANSLVRDFCMSKPHLRFIDVSQLMIDKNGTIKDDIFLGDKIHLNPSGYRLWETLVRPYLSDCGKK
ncbi:MAG: hypothetical protein PWQ06_881 [Anaerophaga sp.]|jgi:lysophospholipase L1-like esterase|uniref:GDSL-type esterase/lipase family protein n=1 Tax=Anaerophaga thermohalophila TaxID=177400 RepID=UPI000237C440|nr:GDSL-type esterase/lipase family protein [Anaerophaga thermohalophila]MDN5290642.1 hypothetical protein [Anaerophaga sp.]